MRYAPTILMLIAVSVSASAPTASAQAPATIASCAVAGVGSPDSAWRQVRGSGFTFCVPADWHARGHGRGSLDAKDWTGNDGRVTWDLGTAPSSMPERAGDITGTVTVISPGTPVQLPPPEPSPTPGDASLCQEPTTTPRLVDGVVLFITQGHCEGTWITTAWSVKPRMYVRGEAHGEETAKLQAQVMQTVRFAAPSY